MSDDSDPTSPSELTGPEAFTSFHLNQLLDSLGNLGLTPEQFQYFLRLWSYIGIYQTKPTPADGTPLFTAPPTASGSATPDKNGEGGLPRKPDLIIDMGNGWYAYDYKTFLLSSVSDGDRLFSTGQAIETGAQMAKLLSARGATEVSIQSNVPAIKVATWVACQEAGLVVSNFDPSQDYSALLKQIEKARKKSITRTQTTPGLELGPGTHGGGGGGA